MKRMANKKTIRGEKGQALILVLILMTIGGLIIAPLLSYMTSGLIVQQTYEYIADELYAANSGVENAIWYLTTDALELLEGQQGNLPEDTMNNQTVNVTVMNLGAREYQGQEFDPVFKVISTAGNTTIEAFITSEFPDYSGMLENVITSTEEVTLQPGAIVDPPEKIVDDYPLEDWPSAAVLMAYYWGQVEDAPSYVVDTTIEFDSDTEIGPLYVDGNLTLRSTTNDVTLKLNGTVYVTGTLTTDQNKSFALDFNNRTIFVENDASYPPGAVNIGSKTSIIGSGCLIAVGGIDFGPNVAQGSLSDFLFVMSINDEVFAHPQGNFNGSFAGKVEVQLQSGSNITWNDPSDNGLNFPGAGDDGISEVIDPQIRAWEIN